MLIHLLLIINIIIIYEFLNFIKIFRLINKILSIYIKFFELLKNKKLNNNQLEKLLIKYSRSLLIKSLKLLILILFIIILLYSINFLYSNFFEKIYSLIGVIETSIYILIYHKVRNLINVRL